MESIRMKHKKEASEIVVQETKTTDLEAPQPAGDDCPIIDTEIKLVGTLEVEKAPVEKKIEEDANHKDVTMVEVSQSL